MIAQGKNVLIRTVTYFQVGQIEAFTDDFIFLKNASWVVDTGRFSTALATGTLAEVEVLPGDGMCAVSRTAIVDIFPWTHPLPTVSV